MAGKRKRRHYTKKRRIIVLRMKIASFFLAVLGCICLFFFRDTVSRILHGEFLTEIDSDVTETETENKRIYPWEKEQNNTHVVSSNREKMQLNESMIYTFSQGPKAWNQKSDWSGSWCEEALAGSKFSIFGCGLCDLANIYSTLTSYECSPIDMYNYARKVSTYSPGGGVGAIDWPEMEQTLNTLGFSCEVRDKDDTFEEFSEAIDSAMTAIVLVSSYVDSSYWTDTEGHYVNLWMYNPESEKVFLADSGDPSHNRSWISLRTVYDALKTFGSHQYMLIYDYDETQNTWKHSGISEDWAPPDYYRVKENAD